MTTGNHSSRLLARSLSGYLCGTHSGVLAHRRRERLLPDELASAHRSLQQRASGAGSSLGGRLWVPPESSARLQSELRSILARPGVVDLVLYGSQSRGSVTGFSDVDALLVIDDEVAEDPKVLGRLRQDVLAAQRSVLGYQPMQHHAFEVATRKLLLTADVALDLPADAFQSCASLTGTAVRAHFSRTLGGTRERLQTLARSVSTARRWPRHPWVLHGLVSMFELLPTLYLQARGRMVPKWQSFGAAAEDFGRAWWPYDVLAEVRRVWPREQRSGLARASTALRNPWAAVAGWTRLPSNRPAELAPLLTQQCLKALQELARKMAVEDR